MKNRDKTAYVLGRAFVDRGRHVYPIYQQLLMCQAVNRESFLRSHLKTKFEPGILLGLMKRAGNSQCGWRALRLVLCCVLAAMYACAVNPIFSPMVMDGMDEHFDVAVWWKTPNAVVGRKVELGGRLVRAEVRNGETFLVASHLPIVDQLVYESFESHRALKEYGIYYRATIDPKWLSAGNHLMVVGMTSQAKPFHPGGRQQAIPFVTAECLHLWKSAGTPPPALPLAAAEKFAVLEQMTYCTSGY